jgi:hypothetical protein
MISITFHFACLIYLQSGKYFFFCVDTVNLIEGAFTK